MFNINTLLKDIASDSSVVPHDGIIRDKLPEARAIVSDKTSELFLPGDRVIWTAANSKKEIIAEHKAEVIRVTETRIYIKTEGKNGNEGYFRYVHANRLRKV